MRLVESVLGPDCVRQGPVILGHNPAADQIEFDAKLAHPRGEEGISFIRVIRGTINPGPDAFVLYESSHSVDHFTEQNAPQIQPLAAPDKLFILRGALRCKIKPPSGCVLVWVGFSTQPIGERKRAEDVFPCHDVGEADTVTIGELDEFLRT